MKNIFFVVMLISAFISNAQDRTNFDTEQYTIAREQVGNEVAPTLEENPYLAVSVLFRGESNLRNKDFIGYFNKMKFFYTEIVIEYDDRGNQSKRESSPLYLLQSEKGVFSTNVFKDKTVILKLPVSKYSAKMPSVTLNTKTNLENQPIKIIKFVSDQIVPLAANPTSVFGPTAILNAYGFVNNLIGQLSESKTINCAVGFDAFSPERLGIKPLEYKVIILKRDVDKISAKGFVIKKDAYDGKIKLYRDDIEYVEHPHFIIEIGLSNYIDITGMPLQFYKSRGRCDITNAELNKLQIYFEDQKIKLSNTQEPAEYNLLNLYEYKMSIDAGVSAQANADESKLLKAYNTMHSFYKTKNQLNLESTLYESQYKNTFEKFTSEKAGAEGCLIKSIKSLAFSPVVTQIFPILEKRPQDITNNELLDLKTYVSATSSLSYITKSSFNSNAVVLIGYIETQTYLKNFSDLIKSITSAGTVTPSVSTQMRKLANLRSKYDNCSLCQFESEKASTHFNELVNNLNVLRKNANFAIVAANDAISKASTTIKKSELLSVASIQTSVDSATITKELNDMVLDRNSLTEHLANITISPTNKIAIEALMAKIQTSSKLIDDYEGQVSTLFEAKKALLSKAKLSAEM